MAMGCGASAPPRDPLDEPVVHRPRKQQLMGEFLIRKFRQPAAASGGVSGLQEAMQELLDNGADLDYTDDEKQWTAYHHACDEGELHKVMMLVNAGCDTGKLTPAGQSGWERATQFSQRAPTPARQTGCQAVATFLESVARKGAHVNLRFEWGKQMIAEGMQLEEERNWEGAHSAYKVGAARLNHRANQVNARTKVLLMECMHKFGPEPEPEPEREDPDSASRMRVPTWVHPAQRTAVREALFAERDSGFKELAAASIRREEAIEARKAKSAEAEQAREELEAQARARAARKAEAQAAAAAATLEDKARAEAEAAARAAAEAERAKLADEDRMAAEALAARKIRQDKEDADAAFENSIHKRAELRTLKVKPLLAIVMHAGVEEDATEDAMDAEDPKEAVIDLYFEAIARSRKEREEEGALMEAAEEARRQVAEREAAEREAVRAAAVEKANQRAAREAAAAEELRKEVEAEELRKAAAKEAAAAAERERVAAEKRRGWWEEDGVVHVQGLAFLRTIDELGWEEVHSGNGLSTDDLDELPKTETLPERRKRRNRIKEQDAAARSTLRELFLSSWEGRPIEDTLTLEQLYAYANDWLVPAPPLIETDAASAVAQLSPNMASVPAELLHCLQRVEEHLREAQARVFTRELADQQRQMAAWTAALRGGARLAPVSPEHPALEWAADLAPKSRYRDLACHVSQTTPLALPWQPPRKRSPAPPPVKRPKPPQALVNRLEDRLQERQ